MPLDGAKSHNLIQQQLPNLVLLGLVLGSTDGLDICRHLKNGSRTQPISIIMITAKGEENDVIPPSCHILVIFVRFNTLMKLIMG